MPKKEFNYYDNQFSDFKEGNNFYMQIQEFENGNLASQTNTFSLSFEAVQEIKELLEKYDKN